MSSFLKNVFSILFICMVSLLLFNITFGNRTRVFMWNAIHTSVEKAWSDNTLKDGKVVDDTLTEHFNNVRDLSYK